MTSKINSVQLAALALNVSRTWKSNFPAYQVSFTNYNDLEAISLAFEQVSQKKDDKNGFKRVNTDQLAVVNKKIDRAISNLKKQLQAFYPEQNNLAVLFEIYGIEKDTKGHSFRFPRDNDHRKRSLTRLIAQLQAIDSPFANNQPLLNEWTALQTEHAAQWDMSCQLKAEKTGFVRAVNKQHEEMRRLLNKLQMQIRVDFAEEEDLPKVIREFGFLKEVYEGLAPTPVKTKEEKEKAEKAKALKKEAKAQLLKEKQLKKQQAKAKEQEAPPKE